VIKKEENNWGRNLCFKRIKGLQIVRVTWKSVFYYNFKLVCIRGCG